jgi:hypothetical protein
MSLAILRQAMKNASTPEEDGKVITLPPASLDNLVEQVKQAEKRLADAAARHGKEIASMTWQHQSDEKAMDARHSQERKDLEAELTRTQEMFLKALAGHKLGIDVDALAAKPSEAS